MTIHYFVINASIPMLVFALGIFLGKRRTRRHKAHLKSQLR
jgi:drug/metabolite transporter (DMT)-like permease